MNSGSIDVTNALASGSIEQKDTHSYFRSRCERDNGNETRRLEELEMHAPYRISEMIDCFNQLLLVDYAESVRPPGCFRLIAASLSQSSGRHHANMDFARPFCLSARRSLRSLEPPSPRPICTCTAPDPALRPRAIANEQVRAITIPSRHISNRRRQWPRRPDHHSSGGGALIPPPPPRLSTSNPSSARTRSGERVAMSHANTVAAMMPPLRPRIHPAPVVAVHRRRPEVALFELKMRRMHPKRQVLAHTLAEDDIRGENIASIDTLPCDITST